MTANTPETLTSAALSFQLMTRAEPPELVIATIKSLLAVKEARDEILIIDNNNKETSLYKPLAAFCQSLDAELNVHFYHIDRVEGFKAGALNLALGLMSPDCSHIVVVDSDYQALPHARASITRAIAQYPEHTLLQFPQFYRNEGQLDAHSELNHYFNHHLYRPFNRNRALSTGTYAVIRRSDLLSIGGWSGASITEDAQMGVLMHRQGFRSQFVPEVIATGLLPNTLDDLICQRRRWIYGNMQVLTDYLSVPYNSPVQYVSQSKSMSERLAYIRAHLSQLSAWVNFTGFFILLHICSLLVMVDMLLVNNVDVSMLAPLYVVYAGYAFFILRRLWAYSRDQSPLNKQIDDSHQPRFSRKVRAWLMHLNFWEIGALSWLPVLWGREKPFVCTPKQNYIQNRQSLFLKNIAALPKLLLVLNIITAIVVAPFSPLYSPVLFICAAAVCILKLSAAKVAMDNFSDARADMPSMSKVLKQTLKVAHEKKTTITTSYATSLFKDKKTIDS
ncbi:glycosyltransferase family 2 protein [Psychrobacter proteolyticus]|uniref:Glycosyltransferase family 2 protein n=1 Tax=Psychrobacter proteolyticus TaxID=147825 RepID=A0ABV0D3E6_9GAMM